MSDDGGATVLVERTGPRVDIVLNRPERKNAVTNKLALALRDALVAVASDAAVGAVVLRGAGGAFCSGIDLKAGTPGSVTAWVEVHQALHRCGVPVVVALERYAINAGASLVLGGNLVVAGERAFLQVGEIAMGVAAPMCQAWLHLRHSAAVADRVTLVGDRISSPELLRLGLVTEVVPDGEVVTRAQALADAVAAHPERGRRAVLDVWRGLRSPATDMDAWFAEVAALGRVAP